jgi:hypothetical protein
MLTTLFGIVCGAGEEGEEKELSANLCWTLPFATAKIISENTATSEGCYHDDDEIAALGLQPQAGRVHSVNAPGQCLA